MRLVLVVVLAGAALVGCSGSVPEREPLSRAGFVAEANDRLGVQMLDIVWQGVADALCAESAAGGDPASLRDKYPLMPDPVWEWVVVEAPRTYCP